MKPIAINYEVLLSTRCEFSKRQLCEKNDCQPNHSIEGGLEQACWNGLVFEIFPDIIEHPLQKNLGYIWEVVPAENFIEVNIGAAPCPVEFVTSVNLFISFEKKPQLNTPF